MEEQQQQQNKEHKEHKEHTEQHKEQQNKKNDNNAKKKPLCTYGEDCYRKNPSHLRKYYHPAKEASSGYEDAWDDFHVKLPCSPHNTYEREGDPRAGRQLSRWYLIQTILRSLLETIQKNKSGGPSSVDLQDAITAYNCTDRKRYAQYWRFGALHHFFAEIATVEESKRFFGDTLPFIITLALRLPELCPKPIPLLLPTAATSTPSTQKESNSSDTKADNPNTITLTQEQVACLLANAFLCTFPREEDRYDSNNKKMKKQKRSHHFAFQTFSFHTLFVGVGSDGQGECLPNQAAKLRCILHYFERISHSMPKGNITFQRVAIGEDQVPQWHSSDLPLTTAKVDESGFIEDQRDALQIDFANRMIGGGVLGYGCIQEEIRFVINTELISSLLFTSALEDNECLLVIGSERYCDYKGYAKTFKFTGDYKDDTPLDEMGRKRTRIVAMDALYFGMGSTRARLHQYEPTKIHRELTKCYCAFSTALPNQSIATGNWGCGAFGGFHDLKALIQLIAASQLRRPLIYCTFGEEGLADCLSEVCDLLSKRKITVGGLWQIIMEVSEETGGDRSNNNKINQGKSNKEKEKGKDEQIEGDLIDEERDFSSQEEEEAAVPARRQVPQLFNVLFEKLE